MIKNPIYVNFFNDCENIYKNEDTSHWWKSQSFYVYPFSRWRKRRKRKIKKYQHLLTHKKYLMWVNTFFFFFLKSTFIKKLKGCVYGGSFMFKHFFKKYLYFKKTVFLDFWNDINLSWICFSSKIYKDIFYYNFGMFYFFIKNLKIVDLNVFFNNIENFFFDLPEKSIFCVDQQSTPVLKSQLIISINWMIFLNFLKKWYLINIYIFNIQ